MAEFFFWTGVIVWICCALMFAIIILSVWHSNRRAKKEEEFLDDVEKEFRDYWTDGEGQ